MAKLAAGPHAVAEIPLETAEASPWTMEAPSGGLATGPGAGATPPRMIGAVPGGGPLDEDVVEVEAPAVGAVCDDKEALTCSPMPLSRPLSYACIAEIIRSFVAMQHDSILSCSHHQCRSSSNAESSTKPKHCTK